MTQHRILIVDDDKDGLSALERTLRPVYQIVCSETGVQAKKLLQSEKFTVVISDQRLGDSKGTEILEEALRLQPLCSRILLTAFTQTEEIIAAVNKAQVFRYLTKPWDNSELLHVVDQAAQNSALKVERESLLKDLVEKNKLLESKEKELRALNTNLEKLVEQRTWELKKVNDRLSDLAMTDPLTKLLNRRALLTSLQEEIDRSSRYGHPLTVGMIDVDHFKSFNDMEGHVPGDDALKKIASILSSNLRKTDLICRYGGEEFFIAMPETRIVNATEICNRVRSAVEITEFRGIDSIAYLTVSIGLSCFPMHGATPEALIQTADDALYEAKRLGRNRVVTHS